MSRARCFKPETGTSRANCRLEVQQFLIPPVIDKEKWRTFYAAVKKAVEDLHRAADRRLWRFDEDLSPDDFQQEHMRAIIREVVEISTFTAQYYADITEALEGIKE